MNVHSSNSQPEAALAPTATARRARTRSTLVEAARALFAHRGYHQTRVDEITQLAGVATGTFYLHFPDKQAIALELLEELFAAARQAVEHFRRFPPAGRARQAAVREAVRRALEAYSANSALIRVLEEQAPAAGPELAAARRDFYRDLGKSLEWALRAQNEAGGIAFQQPDLVAEALIGAVQRMAYTALIVRGEPLSDSLVEAVVGVIVRLLGWDTGD